MPLGVAPLAIAFEGGVETGTDPKKVPAVKLLDLVNGVFSKADSRSSISKRNGYLALSQAIQDGGGDIANARGLARRGSERLIFTDKRCYSYRPSADRWADAGEVAATTATTLPIARTGSLQTQPDAADRNGIRVVAWEDSRGGVWCSVLEAATKRILVSQTQLDSSTSAQNVRCIAVGDFLHVLWTRADLKQIQLALINTATPALAPVISTLVSDLSTPRPFYDACEATFCPNNVIDKRPGVIVWSRDGTGYRVGYITPAGTLGSPLTGFPSVVTLGNTPNGAMAVCYNHVDRQIAVIWIASNVQTSAHVFSASALAAQRFWNAVSITTGVYTRIAIGVGARAATGTGALYWAAEVTGARTDLCSIESGSLDPGSATPGPITTLRGHCLVSRAWHDGGTLTNAAIDGDVYVMIAHSARFFPYVAALRLSDDSGISSPGNTVVSRLLPGETAGSMMRPTGAGTRAWTTFLPTVMHQDLAATDLYSRSHAVCLPYRIQLSSTNGDQFSEQGIKLASINMLPNYQTVELGRGLYLSSSAPMHYDGEQWREADFHAAPDLGFTTTGAGVDMSTTIAIGAAGAIPNGSYLYAYWYEAMDAQGELHRGAVSVKMLVTMTGGPKKFVHAIPTCRLTRFANVRLCVARSEAGAEGSDSTIPLYRCTDNDVTITTGDNCYVNNNATVDTVAFTDNLTDAQLVTREPLYTNGGIASNSPAPWGGGVIAVAKNRLFWTDTTDPNLLRFSQQIADDTALEAPVELSTQVDPFGGPITAIGVMDDGIYPFKETAVFVVSGPGPLADPSVSPEVNTFSAPERVTSDVGCVSPASIGDTPLGVTFQSSKGIKLLARSRQIIDIGLPVSGLDGQHYTRTTLLPDRRSIVYLTDTDGGFSLLWDYDRNQWSKFSNHLGLDAVVVDGVYHYLRTDSRVFQETPGVYRDDNARIPLRIETAWLRFASYLQGWQKALYAYFLGTFISDHTLNVRFRIDYNDSYSPIIANNVNANYNPSLYGAGLYGAGAYGGSGGDTSRYQRRIHLNRRCQAISFLIEDSEAEGDFGASFELSELLLVGGGLGPAFRVGAARSA